MARQNINNNVNFPSKETLFYFQRQSRDNTGEYKLKLKLKIPIIEPVTELVYRVLSTFKLPIYLHSELLDELKNFVLEETTKLHDDIAAEKIEAVQNGKCDLDEVVRYWENAFKSETAEYAEPAATTDEELFSVVYHKLVHSPALETILQAEQAFADTARTAATNRSDKITALAKKQNEDMANAVKELHTKMSEKEINDLVAKQFEEHSLTDGRLSSELEALHQQQRAEYRAWLMSVMEQLAINPSPLPSPVTATLPEVGPLPPLNELSHWPEQEESFTIHLGSQLKQMHNVRILAAEVLDFCRILPQVGGVEPRRLETALALYSTGLSGLVLLSDVGPIGGFSGLLSDFSKVCRETTELHFPSVEDQLQDMRITISEAVAWRSDRVNNDADQNTRKSVSKNLQQGDAFITRHSNLSQVHVVFHIIVDDSVKSNDMNSRHPVILGLRNVLKTAASYDVTTLTLPLLLSHEMTEDMTVAWCTRRAELVFKCVKGFMMEAAGTGGAELHNLQFLVPPGISPQVFSALAAMLPSIFRVSNPLVLKTTPTTPRDFIKTER